MGTKKAGLSSSLLSLVGLIQPPLTIARRLCHPLLPLRRAMLSIFASPKSPELLTEKPITSGDISSNPVISTSEYAYTATNVVKINQNGAKSAAAYIRDKMRVEAYTPRTWRTHPLHICPVEPFNLSDPGNKTVLNWIFLISALNFSFWSAYEGSASRYGVEWRSGWDLQEREVFTGYWALVAALNKAMADDGIPIIDPHFYSSETLCPDSLIEHVFRPCPESLEGISLLSQRIAIMREVGYILCNSFGGSYHGLIAEFQQRHNGEGTALDLVKMITETFPSFQDEVYYNDRKVYLWKRAQILVAETWAAFYPASPTTPHPLFPSKRGPMIEGLTMFADYRVPQVLHHLRILDYPPSLVQLLSTGKELPPGSREELSIRAASIVAVERVRKEIDRIIRKEELEHKEAENARGEQRQDGAGKVSSVLIDFYLWDLAKRIETGEEALDGLETAPMVPIHRTRSIWY